MRKPHINKLYGILASAALVFVLSGCNGGGSGGSTTIINPPNPGPTTNVAQLTPAQWSQLVLSGSISSASVSNGVPTVTFKVTDGLGLPVVGLAKKAADGSYPNFGFGIAKLVNDSPSRWVNYNVVRTPAAGAAAETGWPEPENMGTLQDNLDGTYTYTFALDISKAKSYADGATYAAPKDKADLDDLTYVPGAAHRLLVTVGGKYSSTDSTQVHTSANAYKDFIPLTGGAVAAVDNRVITEKQDCNSCHTKLSVHADFFPPIQETTLCVVCHTDQMKFGAAESQPPSGTTLTSGGPGVYYSTQKLMGRGLGDFPNMIHKIHMGEGLYYQGYNQLGVMYNETTYPQDQRNCVKCHSASTATPQGDNWNLAPSRKSCGACHDGVDFATGAIDGVPGSHDVQTSDAACGGCHKVEDIKVVHIPVLLTDPNNAFASSQTGGTSTTLSPGNNNTNSSNVAAYSANLPAGTHKITWDLKSLTLDATGHPVFTFRFLEDGVRKDFNPYTVPGPNAEPFWDNYVGGPSFYVAFGYSQDGITAPADWNVTASVYFPNAYRDDGKTADGKQMIIAPNTTSSGKGVLSAAPDGDGYYTLTMVGAIIPAGANMVTGGIGFTYGLATTQPLTQTDVPGYPYTPLVRTAPVGDITGVDKNNPYTATWVGGGGQGGISVPASNTAVPLSGTVPAAWTAAQTTAAKATRRDIVTTAKCNDCHAALGVFTEKTYHAGQRNDAPTCTFCHNVNRANSGWAVNIKEAVHSIHASAKRANLFSWEATAGDTYWKVTYPALLNNCEACHVPGSYDFGNSANAAAIPNLLWSTHVAGRVPAVGDPASNTPGDLRLIQTVRTAEAAIAAAAPASPVFDAQNLAIAPWVTPGTNYGTTAYVPVVGTSGQAGWVPASGGGKGYATRFSGTTGAFSIANQAEQHSLVTSPITAACSSCHLTPAAFAHFKTNGGTHPGFGINPLTTFNFAERTAAGVLPANTEACLVCHASGKDKDVKAVHMNFN